MCAKCFIRTASHPSKYIMHYCYYSCCSDLLWYDGKCSYDRSWNIIGLMLSWMCNDNVGKASVTFLSCLIIVHFETVLFLNENIASETKHSPVSFEQFPPGLGAGACAIEVGVWGCCCPRAVRRRSMENGDWRSPPWTEFMGCWGMGYVNRGDGGNPAAAYDKLYGKGGMPISRPTLKGNVLSNILRSMGTLPPPAFLAASGLKYDNMLCCLLNFACCCE